MRLRLVLLAIAALLSAPETLTAEIIVVPVDQPTIQAGIDAAGYNDIVLVQPGIYFGEGNRDLDFGGKQIVVRGEIDASVTMIDCEGTPADPHRAFWFHSGEGLSSMVQSFTIVNGYAENGGGILCEGSDPTIRGVYFVNCHAERNGGAIRAVHSSVNIVGNGFSTCSAGEIGGDEGGAISLTYCWDVDIRSNHFYWNSAFSGGGVGCFDSRVVIRDNQFIENSANGGGAIGICCNSSVTIDSNYFDANQAVTHGGAIFSNSGAEATIRGNYLSYNSCTDPYSFGGGICCNESSPDIEWNVLIRNSAGHGGGLGFRATSNANAKNNTLFGGIATWGGGVACDGYSVPLLNRCIIAFSASGGAVWTDGSQVPTLVDCDLFGNIGGDWVGDIAAQQDFNLWADPMFCDTALDQCSLSYFSPCAPGIYPNVEPIGALGPTCDHYICGDADADGEVDMDDMTILINYYFRKSDLWPVPVESVDMNCDREIRINDIIILANVVHGYGTGNCCANPSVPDDPLQPEGSIHHGY